MSMGRIREMLKLNPDLSIDIMGPQLDTVITQPFDINPDLPWDTERLRYISRPIIPNALATRYDFKFEGLANTLQLRSKQYHSVLINDPMHLRNFMAMFFVVAGYQPRFYVHSHFIDNPECPKFPTQASLWLGQCEAAVKADYNFWQCESAMNVFFESMGKQFQPSVVDAVRAKSLPWDDGYSAAEITSPVNHDNMRFTSEEFKQRVGDKVVIFVPNRIGGRGRSSDYTNCGKFMFELLPELRKRRQDFVVLAGNPSQKFFNHELEQECGPNGYVSLVPDAFNRDEFKYVARNSSIAVGLYDQDSYGGTVARECVELGCLPLWLDNYEYSSIAREVNGYPYVIKPDWSDFVERASALIDHVKQHQDVTHKSAWLYRLQQVVRDRCSYEATTPAAMAKMGLLPEDEIAVR